MHSLPLGGDWGANLRSQFCCCCARVYFSLANPALFPPLSRSVRPLLKSWDPEGVVLSGRYGWACRAEDEMVEEQLAADLPQPQKVYAAPRHTTPYQCHGAPPPGLGSRAAPQIS